MKYKHWWQLQEWQRCSGHDLKQTGATLGGHYHDNQGLQQETDRFNCFLCERINNIHDVGI